MPPASKVPALYTDRALDHLNSHKRTVGAAREPKMVDPKHDYLASRRRPPP